MNFNVWAILAFVIIFGVVVVAHEFGHFIVAKANGIKVL
ncbi:MAG: site-2 protease family protein, partial [Lachnospiraceae bacterium]|nr:site-2 protease family protein [Lachnospiraceae bacterium]